MKALTRNAIEISAHMLGATWGRVWRFWLRPRASVPGEVMRRLRVLRHVHRFDSVGARCIVGEGFRVNGAMRIHLGESSGFFDFVTLNGNGILRLGRRSTVGQGSILSSYAEIQIGDDVMIGQYCYIMDSDHEFASHVNPMTRQPLRCRPVIIGNDVWIGAHTLILRGVHIGDGVVVGANSVVTHDLPGYAIAVGSPARVIRQRNEIFDNAQIPLGEANGTCS